MSGAAGGLGRILMMNALLAAILALGVFLVVGIGGTENISRMIYFTVDFPGFVVVVLVSLLAMLPVLHGEAARRVAGWSLARIDVRWIAALSLGLSVWCVHLVHDGYALSMDEWMTRLQGEIFLDGAVTATLPEEWRAYGRGMFQGFANYDPASGSLASNYRPGMALLHAAFSMVGLGLYTSAILNAAAILLVARVARQLFPDHAEVPVVAALLLATSQQAFAASLTSYAMSAHLCFNLAWVTLFLDDRWQRHVLAALVGVLTASLHQIHLHLFFALPFLLTLLRPFRPGLIALYGAIYLGGHLAVLGWDWLSFNRHLLAGSAQPIGGELPPASPAPGTAERARAMLRGTGADSTVTVAANLVRLIAWQSLALLPLLLLALRLGSAFRYQRALIASFALSLLPYLLLMPDQGHGWGYRYLHGLLGSLALLALPGWLVLRAAGGAVKLHAWIVVLLIGSPLLLLPFRGWQIAQFVGPYARATAMVAAQDADVVIVNGFQVWIGGDIPRNSPVDPQRPIQMSDRRLTPAQIEALCRDYRVAIPPPAAYAALGVRTSPEPVPTLREAFVARNAALEGCRQ